MTMLNANDPSFWEQYPNGVDTYDAWGRRIPFVVVSNPATGEVIRFESDGGGMAVATDVAGCPWRRHGFHPAPLRVVARRPAVEGTLGRMS
jgi:hypothetical protein